ncbi:RimK family alpha-L-glutamate ligase [Streptomyces sp. NPDC001339]|uniref:ATP-grasp domain-containing protein n=1 Tax=Streptomyces sp. NPDC001339 TaxID=3364563 RepID=UPI0036C9C701
MKVGLITANPGHPVLVAVTRLLTPEHEVVHLDPEHEVVCLGPEREEVVRLGPEREEVRLGPEGACHGPADVYLLKARTPRALALAARLEESGARVINSAAATARCQDRVEMAERARAAGLPFARTLAVMTPRELAAAGEPPVPLVIKSRNSRRHDLVARADGAVRLRELAADWPEEPVVVQEFTANSGWDHKLWVVAGRLFAGLRRSELSPEGRGGTLPLPVAELPAAWVEAVLRVGEVFELDVYGVDVLDAGGGAPLIVDINAFPGIRGQAGAPEALAELALSTAMRNGGSRTAMGDGGSRTAMSDGGSRTAMGDGGSRTAMGDGGIRTAKRDGGIRTAMRDEGKVSEVAWR